MAQANNKTNNKLYKNIIIDTNRVEKLTEEGYFDVPSALINIDKSVSAYDYGLEEDQENKLSIEALRLFQFYSDKYRTELDRFNKVIKWITSPTLFPDCVGHSTNNCIVRSISRNEIETFPPKIKYLIKFAKKMMECGIIGL